LKGILFSFFNCKSRGKFGKVCLTGIGHGAVVFAAVLEYVAKRHLAFVFQLSKEGLSFRNFDRGNFLHYCSKQAVPSSPLSLAKARLFKREVLTKH
jgi:hypothetical protein